MDEKLTPAQEYYLFNENIYVPFKIDYRILVYLNLGYEILLKTHTETLFKYRTFRLNTYTSNSVSIYDFKLLKSNEIGVPFFNKIIHRFSITKEDAQKWIEANS